MTVQADDTPLRESRLALEIHSPILKQVLLGVATSFAIARMYFNEQPQIRMWLRGSMSE